MNAHEQFSQAKDLAEANKAQWLVEAHKTAKKIEDAIALGALAMAERHMLFFDHCEAEAEKAASRARWYWGHASMYAKEAAE